MVPRGSAHAKPFSEGRTHYQPNTGIHEGMNPATPASPKNLAAITRQITTEILVWSSGLAGLSLVLRVLVGG